MAHEPKTLQEAIQYFADPNNCIDYLANRRWGKDGVVCPTCGSREVSFVPSRRVWQCKTRHPRCQFSIKVGTIFEDSPIGLDKWLTAMWMVANCKNGVSSWEVHRALGVTQKSAWFMLQRIRLALQDKSAGGKLGGGPHSKVEIDETFIGGKARNMHKSRRDRMTTFASKTAVMGMLERGGKVKATVLGNKRRGSQMQEIVRENVASGAWLMTDEFNGYAGLSKDYTHLVINHLERYVQGNVHTQGIENFWSLLKRTLGGTYVAVEPFHLFRYVDEQAFRFNNRKDVDGKKLTDADRFDIAVSQIVGKRLTYAEVTGKVGETAAF